MRSGLKWLPAFLALAFPLAAEAAEWRAFTSPAGGFSVFLPGAPTFSRQTRRTAVGLIEENYYRLDSAEARYSVEYQDLPGLAVFFASAGKIYNETRFGVLEKYRGKEIGYREIEFAGHPGRELVFEMPAPGGGRGIWIEKARFLLAGGRLYVLEAGVPETKGETAGIDRFLDSFRLLK